MACSVDSVVISHTEDYSASLGIAHVNCPPLLSNVKQNTETSLPFNLLFAILFQHLTHNKKMLGVA